MTKEELIVKAGAGDADAILKLVDAFAEENDWTEAIDWADRAAEAGDLHGMYRAAQLHHLRAMSLLKGNAQLFHLMMEDGKAAYLNAGVLISMLQGKAESEDGLDDDLMEMYDELLGFYRDGLYCEAYAYYKDDTLAGNDDDPFANFVKVISLLKDVDSPRESALCGLCCVMYPGLQYRTEAAEKFEAVLSDWEYMDAEKTKAEEDILDLGMVFYALQLNEARQYEHAVHALNYAVAAVKSGMSSAYYTLKNYKKTLFGGWKYVG